LHDGFVNSLFQLQQRRRKAALCQAYSWEIKEGRPENPKPGDPGQESPGAKPLLLTLTLPTTLGLQIIFS
jgi:hypothetical protein